MGTEVGHLAAGIVVIEAEVVKAAILMIGRFGRRTEPEVVIKPFGHRHRFPARTRAGLVVPAYVRDHALNLANRALLNKLAGSPHDRVRSLMRAALQDALVLPHGF